jgi:hypothetical protein
MSVSVMAASRHAHRQARRFRIFSVLFVLATVAALQWASPDGRVVLAPAVALAAITLLYFSVQIGREQHLPIFEAATFFVLATAIYSIVPLLQFVLGGMEFGPTSDNRLYQWQPTPAEFGNFAWRHVVLLATFVLVYLPVRGRRLWPLRTPVRPMRTTTTVIIATVISLSVWFFALTLYMGPGVSVYQGGTGTFLRPVPHIVLQMANVLHMVRLTLKQCLVILLLLGWKRHIYRLVLFGWIAAEAVMTVVALESRVSTMILLLTFAVGYHRLVRPLRVAFAFASGAAVLLGFLLFGVVRDVDPYAREERGVWGAATEFQILYGNAYDLHMRRTMKMLPELPRQLPYCDVYRLIPSQLLPFYKWDPSQWYVDEVLGLGGTGTGVMFGIVAQAVVGFGYYELIVRAFLLALFYAFAHRFYRRYSRSFWMTIAYLFILTWAYYAFRSTSFEILYRLVYYLVPTWLIVKLLTIVVTRARASWQRMAVAT